MSRYRIAAKCLIVEFAKKQREGGLGDIHLPPEVQNIWWVRFQSIGGLTDNEKDSDLFTLIIHFEAIMLANLRFVSMVGILALCPIPIACTSNSSSASGVVIGKAELITSSADFHLAVVGNMDITASGPGAPEAGFVIDDTVKYQVMDGFGASFLEAGLVTLNTLPDTQSQDQVLKTIFDMNEGSGFSLMKTVIGATDFQSAYPIWYTCDDVPGDTSLNNFSIARDLEPNGLVTYIKRAQSAGGNFRLQAPMDYPPDWMLYDVNNNQNLNYLYYPVFAEYLVKYIQFYQSQGIDIYELSPFNEPTIYTKINYSEIDDLIKNYIGPAFEANNLDTKLGISEAFSRENAGENYPIVLGDPVANNYISIVPYHGYFWSNYNNIANLVNSYPDKKFWMTEICLVPGFSDVDRAITLSSSMFSDIEAGASGWIFWNMILDENGGPWLVSPEHEDPVQNAQDSLIVINSLTHQVTYTDKFYFLSHFSKYVRPGAQLISTKPTATNGLAVLTFKNPDQSFVSQILNTTSLLLFTSISGNNYSINFMCYPNSISTLIWSAPQT